MSRLPRWKENRFRQEIYLGHHTNTSLSGTGFNGANRQGWNGTSALFLEETPGMGCKTDPESKEKESVTMDLDHSTCRAFSCLPLGVLRPVRNPSMKPLIKPEVKDHYNDVNDFTDAAQRRSGH